jgi:hypothetical protein
MHFSLLNCTPCLPIGRYQYLDFETLQGLTCNFQKIPFKSDKYFDQQEEKTCDGRLQKSSANLKGCGVKQLKTYKFNRLISW